MLMLTLIETFNYYTTRSYQDGWISISRKICFRVHFFSVVHSIYMYMPVFKKKNWKELNSHDLYYGVDAADFFYFQKKS